MDVESIAESIARSNTDLGRVTSTSTTASWISLLSELLLSASRLRSISLCVLEALLKFSLRGVFEEDEGETAEAGGKVNGGYVAMVLSVNKRESPARIGAECGCECDESETGCSGMWSCESLADEAAAGCWNKE